MAPSDLLFAAGRNQIGLRFSPLADAATGAVAGFLVRPVWEHPTEGEVETADVHALARVLGIAEALDAWVLELACEAAARWGGEALDALALVAVEVASAEAPALAARARAAAEIAGIPPDCLRLIAEPADYTVALMMFGVAPHASRPVGAAEARGLLTGQTVGA